MSASPNPTFPTNIPVSILMPGSKGVWVKAILAEMKGRRGLRWRIFDKGGRSWVCGRDFKPLEWLPILPESGGVQ